MSQYSYLSCMNFDTTKDQQELILRVDNICKKIRSFEEECYIDDKMNEKLVPEFSKIGLLGCPISKKYGGFIYGYSYRKFWLWCKIPETPSTVLNRSLTSRQLYLMFKSLFKKMDSFFFDDDNESAKEGKFFSNVVGYEEIKKLLLRSVLSKEPVNILLTGPPSSSKTVFLLEMLQGLDNAYFIDALT